MLYYSKAFDSVNHKILINELKLYGIQNIAWFESYLSNRTQCVRLGNVISRPRPIVCGVQQGLFWVQFCLIITLMTLHL